MRKKWRYLKAWFIIKQKQFLNFFLPKAKNYTKFVIVCAGRSGSTLLHTYLNSHPQIWSYGEILHRRLTTGKALVPLEKPVFKPHATLIRAVGLKIFYEYQEWEGYQTVFEEIVCDPNIKVIHLIRQDKRQQLISLKRAKQTHQWSSTSNVRARIEVALSEGELEEYEREINRSAMQIREKFASHPVLEITYEALTAHPQEVLRQVQQFLGVQPKALFSLLKKQGES